MWSRPVVHSISVGHSISREMRVWIGEPVGSAGRSALRVWSVARGSGGVLAALLLAFAGVSSMLWLLYELATWWLQLAAQPFPGTGAGLENLFR